MVINHSPQMFKSGSVEICDVFTFVLDACNTCV